MAVNGFFCVYLQFEMKTPTVTLTTDWGERGFFAGMVKGALMRLVEGVQVVDICHRLEAFNVGPASFVVRHACMDFPEGTVHLIDVASQSPFVAIRARGQYYLCADNGLPALVFGDEVEEVVTLPPPEGECRNFAAYSLFCPMAARLLTGTPLTDLGPRHPALLQRPRPSYLPQGEFIHVYVHYIDDYGNAYLGISYREFEALRQGRTFKMLVKELSVSEVSPVYQQGTDPNDLSLRLTVSATGQMELSFPNRSLAQLYGVQVNERVLLKFGN